MHEDRVALALYERCRQTGLPLTLGAAEDLLSDLLGHQDCRCGLCGAATMVKPAGILMVASAWDREISATRRRGRG